MREELDAIDQRTRQVVLPKSDMRKALNYLRNHWTELTRYLDDPRLPIDNNLCEQLMKQIAVSRKNWLFCGSVAGGQRAAGFFTLVSSAHRNDLDVWTYTSTTSSNDCLLGKRTTNRCFPGTGQTRIPSMFASFAKTNVDNARFASRTPERNVGHARSS